MHKHLQRQLRRLNLSDAAPPPNAEVWRELLESVSRTYEDGDNDRYTLEQSITLSSAEMMSLHGRLKAERDRFATIFSDAVVGIARIELDGMISEANPEAARIVGRPIEELRMTHLGSLIHPGEAEASAKNMEALISGQAQSWSGKRRVVRPNGDVVELNVGVAVGRDAEGAPQFLITTMVDETEKNRLELELRHAQKLESVGRLAAGIAHEINTPIQFVGDNLSFLQEAAGTMFQLAERYQQTLARVVDRPLTPAEREELAKAEADADLELLRSHSISALTDSLEGIERVATIVRAMKAFAHPDRGARTRTDLNTALKNTVTVATNELKYVADVVLELGELPPVSCFVSELNQVFLNILINAAHAITDAGRGAGVEGKGTITVRTQRKGDSVLVEISDSGCGIPEEVRAKIFDPFFTTKEVGRGTGQGLAISRSVIADKHGGQIWFESEVGKGTTFFIRLPINPPAPGAVAQAA